MSWPGGDARPRELRIEARRGERSRGRVCAGDNLESQISRDHQSFCVDCDQSILLWCFPSHKPPSLPDPPPSMGRSSHIPRLVGCLAPSLIVSSAMREAPQLDEQSHSVDETVQRRIMANTTPRLRGSSSSRPGLRLLIQVERAAAMRSRTCRARRSALVSRALHSCAAPFFALPYARVGLTPSHALVVRVACAAIHVRTAVYYLPVPFECDTWRHGSRVARRRPRDRRAAATRRTGGGRSRSRGRGRTSSSLRMRARARGGVV